MAGFSFSGRKPPSMTVVPASRAPLVGCFGWPYGPLFFTEMTGRMTRTTPHDHILELARPLADALGLDIWGMELLQGPRLVVRLYVDTQVPPESVQPSETGPDAAFEGVEAGVSVDQCALLSRRLGLALEVEDSISTAYILEVSSPGLERVFFRLEQMAAYVGRRVAATLSSPLDDTTPRRNYTGEILGVEESSFTLRIDADGPEAGETVAIPWERVKRARLVHIYPDQLKAKPKGAPRRKGETKHAQPASGDGGLA